MILVQNYIAVDSDVGCTMPFSWRIKDYLEELWVHAFQQEGIFTSLLSLLFVVAVIVWAVTLKSVWFVLLWLVTVIIGCFVLFYSSRENINNKCPCISFNRTLSRAFWKVFLEYPLGQVHLWSNPRDADGVFPQVSPGFHLHDHEGSISGESRGESQSLSEINFYTSFAHPSTYTCSCVDMFIYLFLIFSSYVKPLLVV